ncbi:MAG TPA: isoprenylcysteine carboxylmethyltransferase family protein [Alphaproteobacteria bacterium]
MTPAQIILGIVLVQRIVELLVARHNTERLLAQGAVELGASHYPYIVLLHAAWFAALAIAVPANAAVSVPWLTVFIVLQLGRIWVIRTLGRYWTTRVISLPGAPLVRHGPYRYVRHPNYLIVAGEIAVLPLVFGEWAIALVFSILNALVLRERIAVEERALMARDKITPLGN